MCMGKESRAGLTPGQEVTVAVREGEAGRGREPQTKILCNKQASQDPADMVK